VSSVGAKAGVLLKTDDLKTPLRTWYSSRAGTRPASAAMALVLAVMLRKAAKALLVGARIVMLFFADVKALRMAGWPATKAVHICEGLSQAGGTVEFTYT
jgi:hypothetical protein